MVGARCSVRIGKHWQRGAGGSGVRGAVAAALPQVAARLAFDFDFDCLFAL